MKTAVQHGVNQKVNKIIDTKNIKTKPSPRRDLNPQPLAIHGKLYSSWATALQPARNFWCESPSMCYVKFWLSITMIFLNNIQVNTLLIRLSVQPSGCPTFVANYKWILVLSSLFSFNANLIARSTSNETLNSKILIWFKGEVIILEVITDPVHQQGDNIYASLHFFSTFKFYLLNQRRPLSAMA